MKIANISVTYLDHMGSDLSVVNAARVSFDKASEFEVSESGEKGLSVRDRGLISYLARHNHWSPFAHTSLQLRIKAPLFVSRQLVKHQVGLVWNEVSRRYVDSEPEFYIPDAWHGRPENVKQGASDNTIDILEYHGAQGKNGITDPFYDAVEIALDTYNYLLDKGVAPEEARMVLPLNTHTEWIWTGSALAFIRVCQQRLDSHAQSATREVAKQIYDIGVQHFPETFNAFITKD